MSQRGSGSGPRDEDAEGEDAAESRPPASHPAPPPASRPIAPYDPYRPAAGELPRLSRRDVADDFERPVSRSSSSSPFLPDDDPLNAEAWQLEFDEVAPSDDEALLPEFDHEAPPTRRTRRQPLTPRTRQETTGRTRRRGRTAAAGAVARAQRPTVTLGVPQVVAGSSLVTDQAMLALLGLNAASILLMVVLLGMRLGGIPTPTVLQLDAAGNPNLWGPPSVLWRLPMMAFFTTVAFLVVAWFLHPIDRFAARFALAAALVAQLIAWVAVMQHLG